MNNFKKEGSNLNPKEYLDIRTNEKINFPSQNEKDHSVAIFWATWCGPCKVEMQRLHDSVLEGKINPQSIYAINAFETGVKVRRFINQSPYKFRFINSPYATRKLQVKSTPTTIFLKGNNVTSMSSGLSLIGIWRAEKHLATK
ncbi:TlpA family protein disulfide reductase [Halobacteriovorax sp. YZS-1-1]|uniref:TlpA family protein disulfide reductase n=1 Tax=unclassified Halobacteriovorax TaxID=2639665 RepID=UPI0039999EDF